MGSTAGVIHNVKRSSERKDCSRSNAAGFSLIELSLGLMVLGLLTVGVVKSYENFRIRNDIGNTSTNIETIASNAMSEFFFTYGRYPCPADLHLSPDDPDYGTEVCSSTPPILPCTAGMPTVGVCRGDGLRDTAVDPDSAVDKILIGAVPFKTLRIEEGASLDAWNRKLTYTVTEYLTDAATYGKNAMAGEGVLMVNNYNPVIGSGYSVGTLTPGEGHFVVLSHGKTGKGAYSRYGQLVEACPSSSDLDRENCDYDGVFFFHTHASSNVRGDDFYDDYVAFKDTDPSRLWNDDKDSGDPLVKHTMTVSAIGIGTDAVGIKMDPDGNIKYELDSDGDPVLDMDGNPVPLYDEYIKVDVDGNVKADKGYAGEFCDDEDNDGNWDDCFRPRIIGGSGVSCGSKEAMTGISHNDANCTLTFTNSITGSCPAGQLMTGISAGGGITCAPPY